MKLIVNGVELDPNQELEIFNDDKGFDIYVTYKPDSFLAKHGVYEATVHNCTEFHHLFSKESSAFESDIHCTGGTRKVNELDCIIVSDATVLHETY
jgi:hypothetical protein